MKFEEAFNAAYDIENDRSIASGKGKLKISRETAKIVSFLWNMLAVSQNKLDDFVYIDKNNNIISIPAETIQIQTKIKEAAGDNDEPGKPGDKANKKSTDKTADKKKSVGKDDSSKAGTDS